MSAEPIVRLIQNEETQGDLKELFQAMTESTGDVPKWMRVMAHCPDILLPFFSLFKTAMDDAPLDNHLKWKIALLVSKLNECSYCVSIAHMKLKSLGHDDTQIEQAAQYPQNDSERLAFAYARSVTEHAYNIEDTLVQEMKQTFSDEEIVELTSVIGLFNYINRFNDALGIFPDL